MSDATPARFACDRRFPGLQVLRLARRAVERHRLDLRGLRVLTEAATGYRRVTPVIAALAGADEVYAVGRDSAQAARRDAEAQTAYLAELAGVQDRVRLFTTRLQAPLAAVDLVTDLPGVRPVDEAILRNVSSTAAVSLMRGAARWHPADVDVAACRRLGIAVAGVDEDAIGLYRYLPMAVVRGLLEAGVELVGASVTVAGEGPGYPYVVRALAQLGAHVYVAAPESAGRIGLYGGEKSGDQLGEDAVLGRLAECDGLVLCPASGDERWVGPGAAVDAARLAEAAPHLAVVTVDAQADGRSIAAAGLRCAPAGGPDAPFELLPQPLVELAAAGLKVAEVMARARQRGSSPLAAEQLAAAEVHADQLPKDLGRARPRAATP